MAKSTISQTHYFDALNTQPLNSGGNLGLQQALKHGWAEPSRLYTSSRNSRQLLEQSRLALATKLSRKPSEVFFAPGFPFAFSHTIDGVLRSNELLNKKILINEVEQSAILSTASKYSCEVLKVDQLARIDADDFKNKINDQNIGIAILQFANHETGSRQPLKQLYPICRAGQIPLIVDATMTHDPAEIEDNYDVLILNPVSWQGPSGISVIVVKEQLSFQTTLKRDKRENHKFPAFPYVPLAVSVAAAFEETSTKIEQINKSQKIAQQKLCKDLAKISKCRVITQPDACLPNIVSAVIADIDGEALLTELNNHGIEISSGSSCIADEIAPSHVIKAIGIENQSNIRISLPLGVNEADTDFLITTLIDSIAKIRKSNAIVSY